MNEERTNYLINKDSWYNNLNKPPWSPPSYVFGIVWPILYFLMFMSFTIIYNDKNCNPYCDAITLFLIQLVLNLVWTTIFFKYKNPKLALIDLILIIIFTLYTYREFDKLNKKASILLIPYILWLFVALSLNSYIVVMN